MDDGDVKQMGRERITGILHPNTKRLFSGLKCSLSLPNFRTENQRWSLSH